MSWYKPDTEFRRLIPDFAWILCTVIVLALLILSHSLIETEHFHLRTVMWVGIGIMVGMVITALVGKSAEEYWVYRFFYPLPTDKKYLRVFLIVTVLCAAFSYTGHISDLKAMLDHHGSLFDWVMGSLTVVGIWLTYNTITESQRIIRSFRQFQSRIVDMAHDTRPDEELHFLAYTASLGFLALKKDEWRELKDALAGLTERLKIVCLDDDDLQLWHNQFIGRTAAGGKTIGLAQAIAATEASRDMTRWAGCSQKLKSEMMPGYYLIFNPRRAIIITPFFIPQYPITITDKVDPSKVARVQMFGFETTDQRIIDDVSALFDHHWQNEHSQLAFFDSQSGTSSQCAQRLAADLSGLIQTAPPDSYLRYRTLVAQEKISGGVILAYLRTRVGEANYQRYLSTADSSWQDCTLHILVPTAEQKTWVDANCSGFLSDAKAALAMNIDIDVIVKGSTP